jgi:diguanylate cyclase (GGDEF)-like protein/PAS domain S-box-containing protein
MNQQEAIVDASRAEWHMRLHRFLMPDYNRKASAYWYAVTAAGMVTILYAMLQVAAMPGAAIVQTLSGVVIATVAGMFPVKIPHSKNSIAAGDIFIFLMLMMIGPAPATLAASCEAAVATSRTSKRWSSRIASPAMAALAMFACGSAFQLVSSHPPVLGSAGLMVGALMLMSVGYFAANAIITTTVVALKRNEPLRPLGVLGDLGWVGLAYAGSASVAALLYLTSRQFGVSVLVAAAPIIAMFLATLHYYFKRQEGDEEVRHARLEAVEREATQAARHVKELQESEMRFHSAFTHASIGMALVAFGGRILQVNESLRTLLGLDESQMVGRGFDEFVSGEDVATFASEIASVDESGVESFAVELRCRHREGHEVWVALHGAFFSDAGASEPCLILQAQDIDARRKAEGRLHHIAFHDGLTSLPNRTRFRESLVRAIELARLGPRHQFAVMFLDFDRFKLINDSMGHAAGDEFLVQVTRRIRENVRPADEVARLGGDEFAILCEGIEREESAVELAERLQKALREPLQIGGNDVATSVSIGITFSTIGYETPEEVLRDADIAMYRAKSCGKARHALFDAGLRAQVSERVEMERDLRRALEAGEISVAYQPMFHLASGKLTGFEALARWSHPVRGLVSPEIFVPLAEEAGLMSAISNFLLDGACQQLSAWQKRHASFAGLRMHINVSGVDVVNPAFVDRVKQAIVGAWLRPEQITLEITENILMDRLDGAVTSLEKLRELGVGVSIDDFGTGYSSLSYLSTLPIDSLKIDRSFVANLREKSKEAEIVRAIVSLGTTLGKKVIAEGIETSEQLHQLRDLGCEAGQGYYLSHPLPPERAEALLDGIHERGVRASSRADRHASAIVLH